MFSATSCVSLIEYYTAYDAVLDRFQLRERLELLLRDIDVNNLDDLASEYSILELTIACGQKASVCLSGCIFLGVSSLQFIDRGRQVSAEYS